MKEDRESWDGCSCLCIDLVAKGRKSGRGLIGGSTLTVSENYMEGAPQEYLRALWWEHHKGV